MDNESNLDKIQLVPGAPRQVTGLDASDHALPEVRLPHIQSVKCDLCGDPARWGHLCDKCRERLRRFIEIRKKIYKRY